MNLFRRKSKEPQGEMFKEVVEHISTLADLNETEETNEKPTFEKEAKLMSINAENVEKIFEKILDRYFITESPNSPGEVISACRLDDIYDVLCEFYGVERDGTSFSAYTK